MVIGSIIDQLNYPCTKLQSNLSNVVNENEKIDKSTHAMVKR